MFQLFKRSNWLIQLQTKLQIPLPFAEFAYICGFFLDLRKPLIFVNSFISVESRTISSVRLWWKPRQNKCSDKIYVNGICTWNPRNSFAFWNLFKHLSLEFRNIQTPSCGRTQWTVLPVILWFYICFKVFLYVLAFETFLRACFGSFLPIVTKRRDPSV